MVMRQSQLQISNAGIHISDVIDHPIFIHDFVTCVLCIFSMSLYQLQFWILYDYLHWVRLLKFSLNLMTQYLILLEIIEI